MKGHQAMMRFEKRRQRQDESIDQFLDDLESLRRRSDPEESTNRRSFSIASKFIVGMRSDDLRKRLATYYTLSKGNAPIPELTRQNSREYILMKPKKCSFPKNRNRQAEKNLHNKEVASCELSKKTVKAVTQVKDATGAETKNSLEINYEKAAAINKIKQDLAPKKSSNG